MPISLQSQASRLKRPRSNSQSNSPSSSPKRAASDSDDHTEPGGGFLRRNIDMTNDAGRASSPLRGMDGDNGAELVDRTEEVHSSEVVDKGNEEYKELYNDFLGSIPPPFNQYDAYYIIPQSFKADLTALAMNDDETKIASSSTDLQLDLKALVENVEGEEVVVIETGMNPDGTRCLVGTGKKHRYWTIKDGLSEDDDFLFIHEDGWNKIMECLGDYDGPKLPRFCLPGETIQLKPPIFTLYIVEPANKDQSSTEAISSTKPLKFTCPTKTPYAVFMRLARRLASGALGPECDTPIMRCWQLDLTNPSSESETLPALDSIILSYKLLPSLAGNIIPDKPGANETIDDFGLVSGDGIVVEIGKMGPFEKEVWAVDVNNEGKAIEKAAAQMPAVPTAPPPLFSKPALFGGVESSGDKSPQRITTRSQSRQPEKRGKGLVGLANLGNTCFMNSAVQCLSNTKELSEYFLSAVYTEELNVDNPLGMHGLIAKAFGMTIENLWTLVNQSFSPRVLKGHTSRFAPQFAGYGQHDTQEFIAFLLDGLHEDLNRIIKKPYIEKPDWKAGGGDRQLAELGKECWDGYKKRNDSVIVDLFQGQLQSTLVCPECHKESITLDPFMYLTVPLPIAQHRQFKMRFVSRDPTQPPIRMRLLIPQNASFQKIKERIGSLLKVNSSHLVGFDLWNGNVYSWFYDSDHNSECKENDEAIFYDLGVPTTTSKRTVGTIATDGSVTVPVFTYKVHDPKHLPHECSLMPFFITLSKAEASDSQAVREAIMKGYQRFVKDSVKANLFVSSTSSHAAVPPPVDEEDEVTDIHVDEPSTDSQDTEAPASIQSQPGLSPKVLQRKAGSSTSLSSLNSTRSLKTTKMVPRGDLFKVNVADASAGSEKSGLGGMFKSKDNTVQPLFKGSMSDAVRVFSPLENRLKIKKGMFNRLTSGLGNIMGSSSSTSASASNADSEAENDSAPTTPNAPQPVIRPGEAIFVEWTVKKYNEYFDTNPDLELVEDPAISLENEKKKKNQSIGIEDCLDEFSKEETLGQDDLWYCPVCKKHQAATKKLEIYKAPDILVICIKRFGSSRRLSDKLDNMVNFPVQGLDMEERVGERRIAKSLNLSDEECQQYDIEPSSEPLVYDLYAVDNHFGGLGGGHYTAFCKNKFDNEWYNYDDSRVSPATEQSIQSRAAYLLFYRRRAVRPIGGKSREKAELASRAVSPMPPSPSGSSSGTSSGASPGPSNRLVLREQPPEAESSPPTYSTLPSPPFASSDSSSDNGVVPDLYRGRYRSDSDADADEEGESGRASVDLQAVGQGLGFGNTAWGTSTGFTRPSGDADVPETTITTMDAESNSGSVTSATEDLGDSESEKKEELRDDSPAFRVEKPAEV